MCGRFENTADKEELQEVFSKYIGHLDIAYDIDDEDFKTDNIAPTNTIKVITLDEDKVFRVKAIKWGIKSKIFDPKRQAAGKDPFLQKDIFNSKIETIKKPGKWKGIFNKSRCVIPMTAFYEWVDKVPQRITIPRNKVFFTSGIITEGIDGKESASIITCEPNKFMKSIHTRMPVLLKTQNAVEFLEATKEIALEMNVPLDNDIKMKVEKAKL